MQETVMFSGTIVCERQRVECTVRATKTIFDKDPSARPLVSGYGIMESDATDSLPDGDYELLVNRERIPLRRNDGRFYSRG